MIFFSKLSLSFATWKRNSSCVLVDNRKHNKPNYNNNHVQMQNCAPTLEQQARQRPNVSIFAQSRGRRIKIPSKIGNSPLSVLISNLPRLGLRSDHGKTPFFYYLIRTNDDFYRLPLTTIRFFARRSNSAELLELFQHFLTNYYIIYFVSKTVLLLQFTRFFCCCYCNLVKLVRLPLPKRRQTHCAFYHRQTALLLLIVNANAVIISFCKSCRFFGTFRKKTRVLTF